MNINENILRVRELMGLINEQAPPPPMPKPISAETNSQESKITYPYFETGQNDKVIVNPPSDAQNVYTLIDDGSGVSRKMFFMPKTEFESLVSSDPSGSTIMDSSNSQPVQEYFKGQKNEQLYKEVVSLITKAINDKSEETNKNKMTSNQNLPFPNPFIK